MKNLTIREFLERGIAAKESGKYKHTNHQTSVLRAAINAEEKASKTSKSLNYFVWDIATEHMSEKLFDSLIGQTDIDYVRKLMQKPKFQAELDSKPREKK